MIFPVQLIININAQVFAAANLFNVIITQLESEVMFFCHLASQKHNNEVLSILKLSLLAVNHLLSEAKLLFALAITSSSDFPCTTITIKRSVVKSLQFCAYLCLAGTA